MKFRNAIFYPQEINDQTEFFFFYIIMRAALIFLEILIWTLKNFKIMQFDNKKCIIIISTIKK